ncbi:MAG TPA: ABC transporter permease [Thermomicrobiaceae bacterium]|nr:ABC transporter permease [Thermomicrobiaceae bacterium]
MRRPSGYERASRTAAPGMKMISSRALRQLLWVEVLQTWRQPIGLVWGVGVPILLLFVFGKVIPGTNRPITPGNELTILDVYIPVLFAMALTLLALASLPVPLVTYREQGWLRRLSTTPVRPIWLLAAQVGINLALAMATLLVVVLGGAIGFGARLPGNPGGFVLGAFLVTVAIFALGLLVAAVAPSQGWASVIGGILFFPLLFLGGLWYPLQDMPATLRTIAGYSPLTAGVSAMQGAMQGVFPSARDLLVLVAFAVVFGIGAARLFRWE